MSSLFAITAVSPTPAVAAAEPAVNAPANADSIRNAVSLAATAGVLATLGDNAASVTTFSASGLLAALASAGTASSTPISIPPAGTNIAGLAQQLEEQGIAATLSSDGGSSGVYSSAGVLENLPGALSDYWAEVLKTNPALANLVASASFTQGVLGTLNVYA